MPKAQWDQRRVASRAALPPAWLAAPPGRASMDIGDAWLRAQAQLLLQVPSIIVPEEVNVVVNPVHPAAVELTAHIARQHVYDPRR